ncbi:hypothetical protein N178_04220 [Priestia aryabhattai B8W22]|nr:hypothetical protein N178_04220 [Priestia aryabhattai B8W22]
MQYKGTKHGLSNVVETETDYIRCNQNKPMRFVFLFAIFKIIADSLLECLNFSNHSMRIQGICKYILPKLLYSLLILTNYGEREKMDD